MLNDEKNFALMLLYILHIFNLKDQYCPNLNTWTKCIHFSSFMEFLGGEAREGEVVCSMYLSIGMYFRYADGKSCILAGLCTITMLNKGPLNA